ncbi:MAG: dynamin family protein, partial [Planctomycetaceae bacterium]|nr:dynamin family protein [Planctomycetaceae bacterium]
MRHADLVQLEMLTHIDRLIDRCDAWPATKSQWEPGERARHFLQRVLPRIRSVRERLQLPLVVAMFGGTGTGKSSLVNAILGQEVTTSGRQRPTTTRPQILVHPDINFDLLQLPTEDCDVVETNVPLLEDIVIVDCPDPDTSEGNDAASNLERLRRFLPYSDILIYTSTQQKYRSANVQQELRDSATGCKLVFVQTHADRDVDIREDWKEHLSRDYEITEMFFVDSRKGLQEQLAGQQASGELARLQNFLMQQLAASNRGRIR